MHFWQVVCRGYLTQMGAGGESKCVNAEYIPPPWTSIIGALYFPPVFWPPTVMLSSQHQLLLFVQTLTSSQLQTTPNTHSHRREHRTSRNKTAHGTGNRNLTEPFLRHHPLQYPSYDDPISPDLPSAANVIIPRVISGPVMKLVPIRINAQRKSINCNDTSTNYQSRGSNSTFLSSFSPWHV